VRPVGSSMCGTACTVRSSGKDWSHCFGEVENLCLVSLSRSDGCSSLNPSLLSYTHPTLQYTNDREGETCNAGLCVVSATCQSGNCTGQARDCNDGNVCTNDACEESVGCSYTDNTAPCDVSYCTGMCGTLFAESLVPCIT
jgi:hypothetical protein